MASNQDSSVHALEAENRQLRHRFDTVVQQLDNFRQRAVENEATMARLRAHEIALLGAHSFHQLIDELTRGLTGAFELDNITLVLADPSYRWQRLMAAGAVESEERRPAQSRLLTTVSLRELSPLFKSLRRPHLGVYNRTLHAKLFPHDPKPRCVALLPLRRHNQLLGVLNLGSCDPERFSDRMRTDLLEQFANISAVFLENVQAREELRLSSYSDGLTGCYNRRFLQERLLQELGAALRYRRPLCFVLFDLDYFKKINDTYGHLIGDEVLREFSHRLRTQSRINDVVARYGGEEFAALLPQTGISDALRLAERIRQQVSKTMLLDGTALKVTVSIGVCELVPRAPDTALEALANELMNRADAALYRAKQAGRDRIERAASLTTQSLGFVDQRATA